MSKKRSKEIDWQERLEYWQERLRLGNWRIQLVLVHADTLPPPAEMETLWGDVEISREEQDATISLAIHRPRRGIEKTLVHELLHILNDQTEILWIELQKRVGSETADLMWVQWDHAREIAINHLAEALVR